MISRSTVQSLYSDCQQFPEPQPSDLLLQMRDTLKCSATFIHQTDPENRRSEQVCVSFWLASARGGIGHAEGFRWRYGIAAL